ncbi:MAG: hypothetical protein FD152_4413 [Xanthobacteraceae bacterium]|nr:MAG: hypothetical protein FD152_4413 [Xanthobacteraceae bacterium]
MINTKRRLKKPGPDGATDLSARSWTSMTEAMANGTRLAQIIQTM